jgi:site-specific recombinase XerD
MPTPAHNTHPLAPHGEVAPPWARETVVAAARWLHTAYTSDNTKTTYATALGIPRAEQALWRGAPTHRNVRELPEPTAFFPWCAQAGLNPFTDMDRERLRVWITVQQHAEVSKTTQKTRLGAVSAWYTEQRYHGRTTFEVRAALPQTERRRLGVSTPAPQTPTVPLTLPQVRALRVAAELYPGAPRLRYRAMVAVLTTTGIRAEELCALRRADLHRAGPGGTPALWIVGKGRKERWVRLPGMALHLLEDYLDARDSAETSREIALPGQVSAKPADQPLFVSATGARLRPRQVTDALRYLCRHLARMNATSSTVRAHAAQLRPIRDTIHPHAIRHFYAVTAEAHGVPVRQISLDLGHSSVAVTERYLEQGRHLAGSAAGVVADLITAGEDLTLLPLPARS